MSIRTETTCRDYSLDALRGLAIVGMILSGNLNNQLPRWMFHAQSPPPLCTFNPAIPGITWVDLVFPFFIFAMGAAIPLALNRKIEKGEPVLRIFLNTIVRVLMLAWFSIYIQYIKPWAISQSPDAKTWIISILGFGLLFPMFLRLPNKFKNWQIAATRIFGFGGVIVLLSFLKFPDGSGFSLYRSDIIILVLANLVLPGTLIWYFTKNNILLRVGLLSFLIAFRLTADINGSWNYLIWNASAFPWLYKFYYWQYLFILIPGTVAGDFLVRFINNEATFLVPNKQTDRKVLLISILLPTVIIFNLVCLLERYLLLNLFVAVVSYLAIELLLMRGKHTYLGFYLNLIRWGAFLLLLGLSFEAFEGGIKKDKSTISYYILTSGLAFYALVALNTVIQYFKRLKRSRLLVYCGQNPMIAYVSASNLIIPLINLIGLGGLMALMNVDPWLGLLKGLIITFLVLLVATFFTKNRIFWRT